MRTFQGTGAGHHETVNRPKPFPLHRPGELAAVAEQIRGCTRCRLATTRMHAVPGGGDPAAPLVLVGEAPGATEDASGEPFQGAAGRHLDATLATLGLTREAVFLAAVVRCRPPRNRDPRPDEIAACADYLERQLALVAPRVVLAMGLVAARRLRPSLRRGARMAEVRGEVTSAPDGAALLATYHPAAAMRFPRLREPFATDVATACRVAGLG